MDATPQAGYNKVLDELRMISTMRRLLELRDLDFSEWSQEDRDALRRLKMFIDGEVRMGREPFPDIIKRAQAGSMEMFDEIRRLGELLERYWRAERKGALSDKGSDQGKEAFSSTESLQQGQETSPSKTTDGHKSAANGNATPSSKESQEACDAYEWRTESTGNVEKRLFKILLHWWERGKGKSLVIKGLGDYMRRREDVEIIAGRHLMAGFYEALKRARKGAPKGTLIMPIWLARKPNSQGPMQMSLQENVTGISKWAMRSSFGDESRYKVIFNYEVDTIKKRILLRNIRHHITDEMAPHKSNVDRALDAIQLMGDWSYNIQQFARERSYTPGFHGPDYLKEKDFDPYQYFEVDIPWGSPDLICPFEGDMPLKEQIKGGWPFAN